MIAALLDINIVLDVFLARPPWMVESVAVLEANRRRTIVGHLSAASLPTIFYIVRRNADLPRAHQVVTECLASFEILPVDRRAIELARTVEGSDFEDNLQVACAMLAGLDAIVTRDSKGFAGSSVPVYSPGEWLAQLPPDDAVR